MNSRQKLIADAEGNGLKIEQRSSGTIIQKGQRDGVIVWGDGSITRLNLLNSQTLTASQARQVLGLTA